MVRFANSDGCDDIARVPGGMLARLFPVLFASLVLFGFTPSVYACLCAAEVRSSPPRDALARADAVFAGKVTDVDTASAFFGGRPHRVVRFDLERTWKGAGAPTAHIATGMGDSDCGFGFEKGKEYLVYANKDRLYGDALATGICSRTRALDLAREDVLALGAGDPPAARSPFLHPTAFAAYALAALLLGVVGTLALSRRVRERVRALPSRMRAVFIVLAVAALAAMVVLGKSAADPVYRRSWYILIFPHSPALELEAVPPVLAPPPDALNRAFNDTSGVPYTDESHATIAQPAQIIGRYLRVLRIGAEEDPDARNTCDAFVVEDGDPDIIAHIRTHISEGNTSSGKEEKGRLIIGLDTDMLSEEARHVLESAFKYPIELSVSLKEHSGKGAPPCYSPLILHDANIVQIGA